MVKTVSKPAAVPTVSEAEATVARLQEQQERVVAERAKAEAETGKYSYAAHAQGDVAAVAELDKIADLIMRHDQKLREISSALATAGLRLQQARQAEAQAQGRGVARELLKRAARLVQLGQTLDDANRIRVEASCAISEELQTMRQIAHGLGVFVPSEQQFLSLGERAERTTLMEMPFHRIAERLAPNEKRNHSSYAQPWRDQIVKGCAALLGDKQDEGIAA
jgi:hypothetical protein